ncbi:hypothetical protein BCR32DRAFT_286326 [Anaeromyces robustus]|uniref:CBM10 domain-containing protein n=1 Tax=Anaeromyces robustus TaxID=1754192 RepID=A0A1Y1VYQ4_9FUNG|nr:hypothetical protein BCR32DRAFT_286326 [Anaeromyces robustus]|eukprot:ORX66393.1 hypothetical protein BCR32DRAFT_286326 [Anaeromyces robustus]
MKNYKILILTAALGISKVSACIPDCWAEKLGYPCCNEYNAEPEFTDEYGENGQKCGILYIDPRINCAPLLPPQEPQEPEYEECMICRSIISVDENNTIWSEEDSTKCIINLDNPTCKKEIKNTNWSFLLGYDTCKEQHEYIYKDNEGLWSIEDEKWCGIQYCQNCMDVESIDKYGNLWSTDEINGNKCIINNINASCIFSLRTSCRSALNGYMCCKNTDKVVYRDDFGSWGIENGQWCGFNEKYPCSWYKEKGYKCCTEIYDDKELYENLTSRYVTEQAELNNEGIFVEINGEVCGLIDNIFMSAD